MKVTFYIIFSLLSEMFTVAQSVSFLLNYEAVQHWSDDPVVTI